MPVIGSGGSTVNVAGQASMRVVAPVARLVTGGGDPTPSGSGVLAASVVLYCPTLTVDDLTPSDGDTMYWVDHTPNLADPDADTGLSDWTTREEFTWSEGWATDNDPTNVLVLVADESWYPSVLAEVTPTGFTALEVLGGQPVTLGCGGATDPSGSMWAGWNIGDATQGSGIDPTQPAFLIVPMGMNADRVRIIDRTGGGDHESLADWIATVRTALATTSESVPNYVLYVPLDVTLFGGTFTGDTATVPSVQDPNVQGVGAKFLFTEQADPANNDGWVITGWTDEIGYWTVELAREDPSPLRAERIGTLLTAYAPGSDDYKLLRVTAVGEVEELAEDAQLVVADYLVAVSAVDGTATTFQPIRRADDAAADGIIPENYLARGGPLNVSDHVGRYVVVPTPDVPADPSDYGRVYRIETPGTPWTALTLAGNESVMVVGGSDVGLPEWWVNRDTGPRPVQMSAHNVRVSRDPTVNTPDTLKPWTDLNEVTTVLARAIEWTFVGVGADWSWPSGLDQPSLWYTVNGDVAVPVAGTLPPLADFPVGRSVRVTSYSPEAVSIVTDEDATVLATLAATDTYEFTSTGAFGWTVTSLSLPSGGGDVAAHIADTDAAHQASAIQLGELTGFLSNMSELSVQALAEELDLFDLTRLPYAVQSPDGTVTDLVALIQDDYDALVSPDTTTLYVTYDTFRLYLGADLIGGGGTVDAVSNVATGTLLGRTTAGSGDSEELDPSAVRALLELEVGTDVQAYDADLAAIGGLTSAADKGIQFTGAGTAATFDLTAAGKALLDDPSVPAQRTTLGVAPPPSLLVTSQYSPSSKIAPTNTGLTNNRLYYVPRLIPRDITISRIAVNQAATGSAGAGSVGKFGVYNNTSDLPAAAFDRPAGTIDLTTGTGIKYVSGTWVLTAGIWWFSFVAQITSGSPTFSTAPPDIAVPSSDGTNNGTKFEGGVTGTLPDPATPGAANTTGAPIIYLYV